MFAFGKCLGKGKCKMNFFESEKELLKEMKSEPEYIQYF